MKWLRWDIGRQDTGYDKMFLLGAYWPIPFDVYLLRFKEGSEIPPHRDKVQSGQHFRFNFILKKAKSGGEFHCENCIYQTARLKIFRSDKYEHSVARISRGTRYVFSIGWVKNA